jgi:hypothetical protein
MPLKWRSELLDMNAVGVGRLARATGTKLSFGLNRPTVSSFDLLQTDRLAPSVVEHASRVKHYQDGVLRMYGIVTPCTDSFEGENERLGVTAADAGYILGRRARQNDAEYGLTDAESHTFTGDKSANVKALIDHENLRGWTGVRTSSVALPVLGADELTIERDKGILEAIRDKANSYDGFDLAFLPADDGGSTVMADLALYAQRGTERPNVRFQYRTGKANVLKVNISNDTNRHTMHEHVVGREAGAAHARSDLVNANAVAAYGGLILDSVDSYPDLFDQPLIDLLAAQLLSWRSMPRRIVTFEPTPVGSNGFEPFVDFDIGDYIHFTLNRGRYAPGSMLGPIDGLVRVYGFTIDIDDTTREGRLSSISIDPNDQGAGA